MFIYLCVLFPGPLRALEFFFGHGPPWPWPLLAPQLVKHLVVAESEDRRGRRVTTQVLPTNLMRQTGNHMPCPKKHTQGNAKVRQG